MKKTIKKTNAMFVLPASFGLSLLLMACGGNEEKKETTDQHDHDMMEHASGDGHDHEHDHGDSGMSGETVQYSKTITPMVDNYLALKNALVADNSKSASEAGEKLASSASSFDISVVDKSKSAEMQEIIEVIKEHGEHISKSNIAHQREHFEMLSTDMSDLIAIMGTDRTLYQQHCPMYNNNKGGDWLSESKEVKNPLFGSKMLTCGSVKNTIAAK